MKEGLQQRMDAGISYLGPRCPEDGTSERYATGGDCVECLHYHAQLARVEKKQGDPVPLKHKRTWKALYTAKQVALVRGWRNQGATWAEIGIFLGGVSASAASNILQHNDKRRAYK